MSLTRDEVRERVISSLRDVVEGDAPIEIDERTDPIKELGLDSADGVDYACLLEEKFSCRIPDDMNPLVNDARSRSRRVGEIVDYVFDLLANDEAVARV